jgi:hypothetical protein
MLSYFDGQSKTVTTSADGSYSLPVSYNWGGSVTPSNTCFTFDPTFRSYGNVSTHQTGQNYASTFNPAAGCSNVNIKIGGSLKGIYGVPTGGRITSTFPVQNGPVNVASTNATSVFTSERAHTAQGFVNEVMGMPDNQLTTQYWFPWYDNISMKSWVLVGKP